jgi:hypothetical protein
LRLTQQVLGLGACQPDGTAVVVFRFVWSIVKV